MNRLDTLSPGLAAKLRGASTKKQRAVCLAACEFALFHAMVEDPAVENALEEIRATGVLRPSTKAELDSLVTRLDDRYLDLQNAADEGRIKAEDFVRPFRQARAVAALSFAGGEDALYAATEATYEAAATTDEKDKFAGMIEAIME